MVPPFSITNTKISVLKCKTISETSINSSFYLSGGQWALYVMPCVSNLILKINKSMNNYHVIMRWKLQIQTVIFSYGKVSFLMLFQGSYHCLEWSAPSLYIQCAQHGAVNCSQTHPEMSGLFPSCAAPAASFPKMRWVKSKPLGYRFQFILLTIKSKVNVEVIICWLRRLTFFTSLFFTHSINLSSR